MRNGRLTIKGLIAALLMASFVIGIFNFNPILSKAFTVSYHESKLYTDTDGSTSWGTTGSQIVYIYPGDLYKNALTVTINDADQKIRNIKCSKDLRYKRSYLKRDYVKNKTTYYFSFYTTKEKIFNFKFKVDSVEYCVKVVSMQPIKSAMFGDKQLSTNSHSLGSENYVTTLKKGKVKIKMNSKYTMTALKVGRYSNNKTGEPTLYWTDFANNTKLTLSDERQVTTSDTITEESMMATTILRVEYVNKKTNVPGSVNYYFNRIVNYDNED